MPARISSTSAAPIRRSVPEKSQPAETKATSWKPTSKKASAEVPLDRWRRLHGDVVEPVKVKTATITDDAKKFAKEISGLTGRQAQDMIDQMNGFGLAEPMWPHFKSMGFKETQAGDLRQAMKTFDTRRRTSLQSTIGTAGLAKRAPELEKRIAEAEKSPKQLALLELELSRFITDNPADLVDAAPEVVKRALITVIETETKLLRSADEPTLRKMKHEGFSSIPLLRELAVLDPTAARSVGKKFADALNAR